MPQGTGYPCFLDLPVMQRARVQPSKEGFLVHSPVQVGTGNVNIFFVLFHTAAQYGRLYGSVPHVGTYCTYMNTSMITGIILRKNGARKPKRHYRYVRHNSPLFLLGLLEESRTWPWTFASSSPWGSWGGLKCKNGVQFFSLNHFLPKGDIGGISNHTGMVKMKK